jgi:cobalt-zinc-cadmium efflux system membrane fusion protein
MKKIAAYLIYLLVILFVVLTTLHRESLKKIEDGLLKIFSQKSQEKSAEIISSPDSSILASQDHETESMIKLTDEQIEKIGLKFQIATPGTMFLTLTTRGKITIDPDRLAHIISKIPGMAKETKKNAGNRAKAGEVIAVLESQEMADLKATYLAAFSREKLTASLFMREEQLYQQGISPAQDYFGAHHAFEEARILSQLAAQKLQAFGLNDQVLRNLVEEPNPNLRFYEIEAPIDGTVLMRHITRGEFIDKSSLIYEIADLSKVWVEMGIYPKDLDRIKVGQTLEVVNLDHQQSAQAELIYISPVIANETMLTKVIALLDNPDGSWRPGAYVKVNIATDQISSPLIISKEAIQKIDGNDCAFIQTEKGFEKREVKLGLCDHQNVEVLSGLSLGEKVVATHPFLLKAELNKDSAKDD